MISLGYECMNYTMYHKNEYTSDLAYTKQFLFRFDSNYAMATRLFPKRIREATLIFYAFVRYADELVDNPEKPIPGKTHTSIGDFDTEWRNLVHTKKLDEKHLHPILRSMYWLCIQYQIPFEYTFDFLESMVSDVDTFEYHGYKDLERYMWGSAGIVGHIMTYIIGYHDVSAFPAARALAEAMQLTNFLRDINEDMQDRNRIYLPQTDMQLFGVTPDMIRNQTMTDELYNLIRYYIQKTETLYTTGEQGIVLLKKGGRLPVFIASRIYGYNLKLLRRRNLNPFLYPKIHVSSLRKIIIVLTSWFVYVRYYYRTFNR